MKDIAVIIPVHELNGEEEVKMLKNAIESVNRCQENYPDRLNMYIVSPNKDVVSEILPDANVLVNNGKADFCSQVNFAACNISEDYFSILEFDDEYKEKWFSMAKKYFYTNEGVSVFLPINIQVISKEGYRQFGNEAPWAMEFSKELGYIDFNCLSGYYGFNITGGIINRNDFIKIGGLKPSIQIAFNYEFLLRLTSKKLKAFVVPKEGYLHVIDRNGSLTDICGKKFGQNEIDKWYMLAQKEYMYDEDRNIDIYTEAKDKE